MSWVLRYKQILLRKIKMDATKEPLNGSDLLQEKEVQLIKFVQEKRFSAEFKALGSRNKAMKKWNQTLWSHVYVYGKPNCAHEITHSLDSDFFIQALRRVISRRGNIKVLYSDNGTNFVGCENEPKKAYKEMDKRIQSFMQSLGGDLVRWIRNPPPYGWYLGGAN